MSLLKKNYLRIMLVIILLLGGVTYLINTTSGINILFKCATHWIPGLEITAVKGNWQALTIKHLYYKIPGITFDVDELHLTLDFNYLRKRQIYIKNFDLHNITAEINISKLWQKSLHEQLKSSSTILSTLSTPYPLILQRMILYNMHVKVNNTQITLKQFSTGFQFYNNTITFTPTRISGLLMKLPTATQVFTNKTITKETIKLHLIDIRTLIQKYVNNKIIPQETLYTKLPLYKIIHAFVAKPFLPLLQLFSLPLNVILLNYYEKNLRLINNVNILITGLRFQLLRNHERAEITLLSINFPYGLLNASGYIELKKCYPVKITINTTINNGLFRGEHIQLTAYGKLYDKLHTKLSLLGPITTQLVLKTQILEKGIRLLFTLNSELLQWPFIGTPQYLARSIKLQISGETKNYHLTFKTLLNVNNLPSVNLTIDTISNTKKCMLLRFRITTLQSYANLNIIINWHNTIHWRTEFSLNRINTTRQSPCLSQLLYGKIISYGSLYNNYWKLQIPEINLHGYFHQKVFIAKGSLYGDASGHWQIPQFILSIGRNQFKLQGKLNNTLILDIIFNVPMLKGILPSLNGQAKGNIKLRGTTHMPKLIVNINIYALHWRSINIANIILRGKIYSSNIIKSNIQLRLNHLHKGILCISQLIVNAIGNEKQHQLELVMKSNSISGQLKLHGNFYQQQKHWQGKLIKTKFNTPLGEWKLIHNMTLDYWTITHHIIIGKHCWKNFNTQFCVLQNTDLSKSKQANLLLHNFNLAKLQVILPTETQTSGIITGKANIHWEADNNLPYGTITLTGNSIKIRQNIYGKLLLIDFQSLIINTIFSKTFTRFTWFIKTHNHGNLNGQIQITNPQNKRWLSGKININNFKLSLFDPLMLQKESLNGLINGILRFDGNIYRPEIYGKIWLEHLIMKDHFIPFTIKDIQLAFSFLGTRSVFKGHINTAQGKVNLTGDADWNKIKAWHTRINIQGNQVRIIELPIIKLDISPNIIFEITPTLFSIKGMVHIPWARIQIKNMLKSAVCISNDEVLLNNHMQKISDQTANNQMLINSNLLIRIGQDVYLDAFGLKARLTGDLRVAQDKQGLGLNGQINIPSGHLHTYGQDLIINKGQLLFSGPLYQPYINIEAIRNPNSTKDHVKAGIRVTGLANQPKIEVFSDPVKSQQEALSYLLRGRYQDISSNDSNIMTSMLISMGIAQSRQVIDKIRQVFGISNLVLDTQGIGNNSQVVISSYIIPGLQIKLGISIFDSLATLTLRYRLMPKLYLEAISGTNQTLDLLYRFEF